MDIAVFALLILHGAFFYLLGRKHEREANEKEIADLKRCLPRWYREWE